MNTRDRLTNRGEEAQRVLPIDDHLNLLSSQHLVSALRPGHPSHAVVTAPPGPRKMKKTLASKHLPSVESHLTDGKTDIALYKSIIGKIHTEVVANTIQTINHSRVLDGPRPDISASELSLSRADRTTLAQLRTGDCHLLNDYLVKTGRSNDAACPECRFRRHTVNHLFSCDATPTNLTTRSLWEDPVDAISFLKTLPSFSRLVSTNPPPPRPPPEPPP